MSTYLDSLLEKARADRAEHEAAIREIDLFLEMHTAYSPECKLHPDEVRKLPAPQHEGDVARVSIIKREFPHPRMFTTNEFRRCAGAPREPSVARECLERLKNDGILERCSSRKANPVYYRLITA